MQDNQIESEPRRAAEMPRLGKLMTFARQHPVLSVAGAAGVGLIGGPEVALGVLFGVGVAVLIDRRSGARSAQAVVDTVEARAADAAEGAHRVRRRAREILDGAPEIVKQRARAVVQAVRGKLAPAPAEQARTHEAARPDADSVPSSAV
ncbi:MAG TPA: hypothetical protein VHW23_17180 [Kofleriaceae bacterium]|jgi:hypothetical protein|nr:hypothetical protein [Kofleriaceae bacterium]